MVGETVYASASGMPAVDAVALGRLGVDPEDAAEVLRTVPSPERDPEIWWLLEQSRCTIQLWGSGASGGAIATGTGALDAEPTVTISGTALSGAASAGIST
jgi:hypothetical protein